MRILAVIGTRPEAIKMIPVIRALKAAPDMELQVCSTGQHREMLRPILAMADVKVDIDLDVMEPNQSLNRLAGKLFHALPDVFAGCRPDRVLVQGDTSSAAVAAQAAFYARIPVGHVEAGLRSHDMNHPFPEEGNRKLVGALADQHYAPTATAARNLLAENVIPAQVFITGNTVIDALFYFKSRMEQDATLQQQYRKEFSFLNDKQRLLLVTAHRRENFDGGIANICQALQKLAQRGDMQIVLPVHMNPNVKHVVTEQLGDKPNIHLIPPQDYLPFLYLMDKSHMVLTDSGGVQEEAPSLGKPVLVMRETTERPEGVEAGTARLIGSSSAETIVQEVSRLFDNEAAHAAMARAQNPYGDGHASERILEILRTGSLAPGKEFSTPLPLKQVAHHA
ncbi:UDP-N-acetylglucosamine 2-epimerase (non-hydrolyzing) [bacterium]|nr:UDP-N-acetylglucosamine 2-epimerase (non-hydrolyzing) [bacterium]